MVKSLNPKELTLLQATELLISQDSFALTPLFSDLPEPLKAEASELKDQIWIASSGTNRQKFIALSRQAIFTSARAVNHWLNISSSDCWALALPLSHVGGFSIIARAHLSASKIVHFNDHWQPFQFCSFLAREKCTLCSFVPTQLFDVISKDLRAPPNLRAVLIGGAALSPTLYNKARLLGWPILPSYGLTECCSQVATASLDSFVDTTELPALHILPHVECSLDSERVLCLKSKALLSAYIETDVNLSSTTLTRVDNEKPFRTSDIAELIVNPQGGSSLKILGRADRQIKIRGWLVCLEQIEHNIQTFLAARGLQLIFAIGTEADSRDGLKLVLHVTSGASIPELLPEINNQLLKQEHVTIEEVVEYKNFPLLENGKIDYRALRRDPLVS